MYDIDLFFDESLECLDAEIIEFLYFSLFLKVIICSIHQILLIVAFLVSLIMLHIILLLIVRWVIRVVNRLRHAFLGNGDRAIDKKTLFLVFSASSHSLFVRSHH
jgi:hypothetical protein